MKISINPTKILLLPKREFLKGRRFEGVFLGIKVEGKSYTLWNWEPIKRKTLLAPTVPLNPSFFLESLLNPHIRTQKFIPKILKNRKNLNLLYWQNLNLENFSGKLSSKNGGLSEMEIWLKTGGDLMVRKANWSWFGSFLEKGFLKWKI